mgnify:CR=1 FL=1
MSETMKQSSTSQHPKRCPLGHKHLSWSRGDNEVSCWDCNRTYPLSECAVEGEIPPMVHKSPASQNAGNIPGRVFIY